MIDGILLINKERGITSYDVIRRLKKIFPKGQKIGHAGTLDPFASGLLVILLGRSTKKMNEILKMDKEYIVKGEFGYATDTQDLTGQKTEISKEVNIVPQKEIEQMIQKYFLGEIEQIPPVYSAKKVKGKKAYEYARKGIEVELKPKTVNVSRFEITEYSWPFIFFRIVCSSGTYIRTLIHDLGVRTERYATAVELQRVRVGKFSLENAIDSDHINSEMNISLVTI